MEQPPAGAAGGVSQEGLVLRETTAPQLSPLQSCRWERCGVENGDTDDPDPVNAEAVCVCVCLHVSQHVYNGKAFLQHF